MLTEETGMDLSWAGFPVGQPNGEVGMPSVASTAESHPGPGVRPAICAMILRSGHLLLASSRLLPLGCGSRVLLPVQEVSAGPGPALASLWFITLINDVEQAAC